MKKLILTILMIFSLTLIKAQTPTTYPNPFNDKLTIDIDTLSGVNLIIIDSKGKEVFNIILSTSEELNTYNLESGLYIVKLIYDDKISINKLIKI